MYVGVRSQRGHGLGPVKGDNDLPGHGQLGRRSSVLATVLLNAKPAHSYGVVAIGSCFLFSPAEMGETAMPVTGSGKKAAFW